jgi:hypothetical protein
MVKKKQAFAILTLVMSLALISCKFGQSLAPTTTPTPTRMSTKTPLPTRMPAASPTNRPVSVTNCEQFGSVDINNKQYVVQSGMWNPSPGGRQCLNVNTVTGAYTVITQTNKSTSGSPATYPFIYMGCHWGYCTNGSAMPIRVSAIRSAASSWSTTTADGIWNVSYDIWFNTTPATSGAPNGAELMIWLNSQGGVRPGGSVVARNVGIGGDLYDVWFSQDSATKYVAYRKTIVATSLTPDIKAFIDDAVSRGYIKPSWYLIAVEAGFEIWDGGVGMSTNSFSVSVNGGGG